MGLGSFSRLSGAPPDSADGSERRDRTTARYPSVRLLGLAVESNPTHGGPANAQQNNRSPTTKSLSHTPAPFPSSLVNLPDSHTARPSITYRLGFASCR